VRACLTMYSIAAPLYRLITKGGHAEYHHGKPGNTPPRGHAATIRRQPGTDTTFRAISAQG
jgi:hypothetical protein